MTVKEIILAEEVECPSYANSISGDGYTAFYFEVNKDLHSGNHAVIYPRKIKNLGKTLDEIKNIYAEKGMRAAIYHPLEDEYYHYFEDNRTVIENCGYEVYHQHDYQYMTLSDVNTIKRNGSLEIKLLDGWDDRIGTDIILPCGEPWELECTRIFASQRPGKNFLFAGFINGNPVIYSIIHKSEKYDCVGFDYILCAKEHRGKGYGSELFSYIVDFCHDRSFNNCYQWAGPSESIVRRAGFCDVFTARNGRIDVKRK